MLTIKLVQQAGRIELTAESWSDKLRKQAINMKKLIAGCIFCLLLHNGNAQIEGPLSGGSFSVITIPGSNQTWANPGNAAASDNVYTSFGNITAGVGSYTDYLAATNFGFSIPSGVTITGIVAEVERADPNFRTSDHSIRIIKGGVLGTTEKSGSSGYPSTDSYQSYGNAGDLWGESWTNTDINASGFGIAVAAKRSVAGGTTAGRIDHIRIIVFYDFTILPVRLIAFTAKKTENHTSIAWITTEESGISHYELERSLNARDYVNITTVTSQNRALQTTYTFIDHSSIPAKTFYRLKIVETNGIVKYSKVIAIQNNQGSPLLLYPTRWQKGTALKIANPFHENILISFYDISGKTTGNVSLNSNEVPAGLLNNFNGIIFYTISDRNGNSRGNGKLIVY